MTLKPGWSFGTENPAFRFGLKYVRMVDSKAFDGFHEGFKADGVMLKIEVRWSIPSRDFICFFYRNGRWFL